MGTRPQLGVAGAANRRYGVSKNEITMAGRRRAERSPTRAVPVVAKIGTDGRADAERGEVPLFRERRNPPRAMSSHAWTDFRGRTGLVPREHGTAVARPGRTARVSGGMAQAAG